MKFLWYWFSKSIVWWNPVLRVLRQISVKTKKIKEINIYDNDRNNGFTLAGNLVKYSVDMATRYGLNEKYAYDYVKPNIRQKKYK